MYIRYRLSLRQVEDLRFERAIDICHETVRFWWNRFGPICAAEIGKRRIQHRSYSRWRWHVDEVFVRINGEMRYLWRAVDHEGEVLEVLCHERPGSRGCAGVPKACDEAVRQASSHRNRPSALLWCGAERGRGRARPDVRSLAQQSSRKFAPAVSTTRGRDGQIQGHQNPAEVCRRSRHLVQSLQHGPPPQPPRHFQADPLGCLGAMASAGGLRSPAADVLETNSH